MELEYMLGELRDGDPGDGQFYVGEILKRINALKKERDAFQLDRDLFVEGSAEWEEECLGLRSRLASTNALLKEAFVEGVLKCGTSEELALIWWEDSAALAERTREHGEGHHQPPILPDEELVRWQHEDTGRMTELPIGKNPGPRWFQIPDHTEPSEDLKAAVERRIKSIMFKVNDHAQAAEDQDSVERAALWEVIKMEVQKLVESGLKFAGEGPLAALEKKIMGPVESVPGTPIQETPEQKELREKISTEVTEAVVQNVMDASYEPERVEIPIKFPSGIYHCRPEVVCLCGSTRFADHHAVMKWELEKQGKIVLMINYLPASYAKEKGWEPHHIGEQAGLKEHLDELHLRKIDMADSVFVLNVGGYIGESTAAEIEYAEKQGKPVYYLEGCGSNEDEEEG